jgi:hypothetical protein
MQLDAGCQLLFEATAPSPLILMLRPRSGLSQQIISGEFKFDPDIPWDEYTDSYGNLCQRLLVPAGSFAVSARTTVDTSDFIDTQPGAPFVPVQDLPDYALQFLLPSRYCQSDLLAELANQIVADISLGLRPGGGHSPLAAHTTLTIATTPAPPLLPLSIPPRAG